LGLKRRENLSKKCATSVLEINRESKIRTGNKEVSSKRIQKLAQPKLNGAKKFSGENFPNPFS